MMALSLWVSILILGICAMQYDRHWRKIPFAVPLPAEPVDGAVGGGVQPPALFDGLIGGVIPYDKGEDGTEVAVFFYDMALAFSDVRLQDGGGRPVVSPLGGIAVPAHLGPGVGVYL